MSTPTRDITIGTIIETRSVSSVYQPIVDLDTGHTVAYEALARGPAGSSLETPDRLFEAAIDAGLTTPLDWLCRAAAIQGALDAGLGSATKLFVNVEPSTLRAPPPSAMAALLEMASSALSIVVEVTERSLLSDPAALVAALSWIRASGMGVAIDDVGADPASLALLPFIEPDVIKLDMSLVHQHSYDQITSIAGAVRADAERRGATILAEGIETKEHLDRALVLGAQLGQGFLFGRPGPLVLQPFRHRRGDNQISFARSEPVAITPWSLVDDWPQRRITDKRLLMPMSHHIEQRALTGDPCVVMGAFQEAHRFTPATARRYEALAAQRSMVGAIGVGMPQQPATGVRGGSLSADHPLAGEWTVTVIGPHDAAALIARDCGHVVADRERSFEYVITHDRAVVLAAARSLMQYIVAT
jgi:EAL domain-containing protein (putative c-di-GMP-specific phosphodiesterase class I)